MALRIGVDEAGYAPNLGPLVVAATAWQVADPDADLYQVLRGCVSPLPADAEAGRIVIADSKQVYRGQGSLAVLERAVLGLLAAVGHRPRSVAELFSLMACPESEASHVAAEDWPEFFECRDIPLPREVDERVISQAAELVSRELQRTGIRLTALAARIVLPEEFNGLLRTCGNKSDLLSSCSLRLVRQMLDVCGDDARVYCDRHGGRAFYAPLIQQHLTEHFVRVVGEDSRSSRYGWEENDRSCEIRFDVGGETELATAAASMIAKYVRELAMWSWNRFWSRMDAGIRPTAGYPRDAKRFLRDVAHLQSRLKIRTERFWRAK
jgi:hypothetical protein